VTVEWLADASPNEHTTTESAGHAAGTPMPRARSIANATPTARGRWLPTVEVCGITVRSG
jgi:hypothetical protein